MGGRRARGRERRWYTHSSARFYTCCLPPATFEPRHATSLRLCVRTIYANIVRFAFRDEPEIRCEKAERISRDARSSPRIEIDRVRDTLFQSVTGCSIRYGCLIKKRRLSKKNRIDMFSSIFWVFIYVRL